MAKIEGNNNDNRLVGTGNNDEIRGRDGDDRLSGRGGNDRLRGDDGNDTLDGGSGNDRLRGDHGNDVLTGGADSDRFIFNRQGGADRVTDFQDGVDKLDFTNFNLTPQEVIDHAAQDGADVLITLDTGETVRLEGFAIGQLDSSDFFTGA